MGFPLPGGKNTTTAGINLAAGGLPLTPRLICIELFRVTRFGAESVRTASQPRVYMQRAAGLEACWPLRMVLAAFRRALPAYSQAARRLCPLGAGLDAPRRSRPPVAEGASPRLMPSRERSRAHGSRGNPPGADPPTVVSPGPRAGVWRPPCQPSPARHQPRTRKIVFEDELPSRVPLRGRRPGTTGPCGQTLRPHPVRDYELKYPPLRNERGRRRYVAVFQDQHAELRKLQREVDDTEAKLQQLEMLLRSLPPPRCQDPGFLRRQARCFYLKGKLRHLKSQIQKFDDQADSEGSVYF
ncbi:occludin/ELL domain-containing protein 1 isoform X2 [Cavia porcellus]|uniref:occludin/ELL domain-containing protein 1 isoform X2 n=1 Tax=Cavia porcellus TaxID=10141 RepID=UPI000661ABF2|nr:occludin/ELL domain-containing protein 1 isoform X2 [Cavia porcellus]